MPANGTNEEPQRLDPSLLHLVPAEIVYNRITIPERENSLGLFNQAVKSLVPPQDAELDKAIDRALNWRAPFPAEPTATRIKEFLRQNQQPLALVNEAIRGGRLQMALRKTNHKGRDTGKAFDYTNWPKLGRLRLLQARQLAADGKVGPAAAELAGVLSLGQMICRADGAFLDYMEGVGLQRRATSAMRALANCRGMPRSGYQTLLASVEQCLSADDGIVQSIRVEFNSVALARLSALPADSDLERTVGAIFSGYRVHSNLKSINSKLDARRQGVLSLLAGHTIPFDRAETIRLAAVTFATSLRNVQGPWAERKADPLHEVRKELELWPEVLSLAPFKLVRVYLYDEQPALSQPELAKARESLKKITNPLGKHVVAEELDPRGMEAMSFRRRADLAATRAIVAVCLNVARNGKMPASLEELVRDNVLATVPLDPFDGKPLRYSPDRAIVWSVGPDGKDNGGVRQDSREATLNLLRKFRPGGAPMPFLQSNDNSRESDLVWDIPPWR
jgi:hypothetical protein